MDLPAFSIAASLAFDGSNPKKFRIKAYDGGLLRLADKPYPVVVDLKGMRTDGQVKALLHHDSDRPVGHMDVAIGDAIEAAGVISVPGPDADLIAASQAAGFQWDASIGAIQDPGTAEIIPPGVRVSVNGRDFTGPLIVARSTVLREVSFVGTGAGSHTSAVLVAALSWGSSMPDPVTPPVAPPVTPPPVTPPVTPPAAPVTPPAAPAVSREEFDKVQASLNLANQQLEQSRRDRVAAAVDGFARQHNVGGDIVASLKTRAAAGTVTEKDVEYEVLKAAAPDFTKWKVAGHVPSQSSPATAAVIEASLLMGLGWSEDELKKAKYDDKTIEAALSSRHRGATMHSLMGAVIQASGRHFSGNFKSNAFIVEAFEANRDIKAQGFTTNPGLTTILENVANKSLLKGYETVAVTWPEICAVRSLSDFKPAAMYRLDNAGQYRKVGQDGELKHIELTNAKYSLQLDTYGAMLAMPRQMIINDDLGAFADIYRMFGDMAANRVDELVWVTVLSNPGNFFSTGNKNYMEGADTVLGIAALKAAKAIFSKQVGANKKPISSRPDRLVVGVGNIVMAESIYTETKLADVVSTAGVLGNNPMHNKYRPIESPWIDNTDILDDEGKAITGQSATAWYLFMDPNVRAAVNIGFLNGNRRPVIESTETDFNTLGIQTRSYSDFGVGMGDPTAAFKSKGAAA